MANDEDKPKTILDCPNYPFNVEVLINLIHSNGIPAVINCLAEAVAKVAQMPFYKTNTFVSLTRNDIDEIIAAAQENPDPKTVESLYHRLGALKQTHGTEALLQAIIKVLRSPEYSTKMEHYMGMMIDKQFLVNYAHPQPPTPDSLGQ
jgi:hypothetical protein